ncbi:MAG: hypothetical protein ACJ746_17470 [Bryobacteraceae bacterium]
MLLISDGLSNQGNPVALAEKCRDAGVPIKTILIDPTLEETALANAISLGGWVRVVGSEDDISATMWQAAERYAPAPATRSLTESPFPTIVTFVGAVLGICGTVTAVASSGLDKPSLFPWALAALSTGTLSASRLRSLRQGGWPRLLYLSRETSRTRRYADAAVEVDLMSLAILASSMFSSRSREKI